jgi:hypothetical protein
LSQSLSDLEAARGRLLQQFLTLGDFRPGTMSGQSHRCGKPNCHCAASGAPGHPQFRLLRKVKGRSVAESFPTPAAFVKAAREVNEYHRFQALISELTALNERICRQRPAEPDEAGWTEEEKKRLLLFIKKSREKSRRFSK